MPLTWNLESYFQTTEQTILTTLRKAEFDFLGVTVLTTVQTPRFCGEFKLTVLFLWNYSDDLVPVNFILIL